MGLLKSAKKEKMVHSLAAVRFAEVFGQTTKQ